MRLMPLLLALAVTACGEPASNGSADDAAEGDLSLELTWTESRPSLGDNRLRMRVTTPEGAPVEGAQVTVEPWMPAHGHGPPVSPAVTDQGDGLYEAYPVRLHMPGRWTLEVEATAPEGALWGRRTLEWDQEG
jgi:hypothetical protein